MSYLFAPWPHPSHFAAGLFFYMLKTKSMSMYYVVAVLTCITLMPLTASSNVSLESQNIIDAFQMSFTLQDDSVVQTVNVPGVIWLRDIMTRQAIKTNATELRQMSDAALVSLAMRAAVAGISPWKRDLLSDRIILSDSSGVPIPETMISDLEIPVYISVICIMTTTIILQHIRAYYLTSQQLSMSPPTSPKT